MSIKSTLKAAVPPGLRDAYHRAQASVAAAAYGNPAARLQVYGVTGTNGKTTTCFFLRSILTAARRQAGLATTVRLSDGVHDDRNDRKMTTMPARDLQALLRRMVGAGSTAAVLEVTSHALAQHRVAGIPFDTVVFTNLTHDHLDYHKTPEAYQAAKERLFALPHRVSVVNADDPRGAAFLAYPAARRLTFSLTQDADVRASAIRADGAGTRFTLAVAGEEQPVRLRLPGRFNVANAVAAAAAAHGSNIPLMTIVAGLEAVGAVPGRLEPIEAGQPFRVLIDYAHTPDALKQLFETVKPGTTGRLIHVGGATGNRDRTKRPLLGAIAAQFADILIVTNEDPDDEDPRAIIDAVVEGVRRGAGTRKRLVKHENFFVIEDRAEAIRTALRLAEPGDTVLVTGKGDESAMMVRGRLTPYSDRETILAALTGQGQR